VLLLEKDVSLVLLAPRGVLLHEAGEPRPVLCEILIVHGDIDPAAAIPLGAGLRPRDVTLIFPNIPDKPGNRWGSTMYHICAMVRKEKGCRRAPPVPTIPLTFAMQSDKFNKCMPEIRGT
jgi:hypothetical protein